MFRSGVKALLTTHSFLTIASLSNSMIAGNSESHEEEALDANYYRTVTSTVSSMYGGRPIGIDAAKFHPDVSFEDPAVVCCGEREVHEAFRALRVLEPVSLSPPRLVDVQPKAEIIVLKYQLKQRYANILDVNSSLIVDIGLHDGHFSITRIEERWNDVQPFRSLLFWIPRRVNGLISLCLTTRVVANV